MKRTLSFLLALLLALPLTACGATTKEPQTEATPATAVPTLAVEEAETANTIAHLLEKYKTVTYAQLDYIGGNTIHKTYFKDENGNCAATEEDNGYQCYSTDALDVTRHAGASEYTVFSGKERYVSDALLMVADSQFAGQTTNAAGNLVCETVADIDQDYADALSETWAATTDDKMVTTAVFAPDDFRVLSLEYTLRHPDGSEETIASGVILYDLEVEHAEAVQDYLDAEKHSVTIQMADGTTRLALIPAGAAFTWDCDEGYALYLDKDGKQPLPEIPDPVMGDWNLYCLPKS